MGDLNPNLHEAQFRRVLGDKTRGFQWGDHAGMRDDQGESVHSIKADLGDGRGLSAWHGPSWGDEPKRKWTVGDIPKHTVVSN